MALLVHSGTSGATYNSYASLADADSFHADRATPEWVAVTDDAVKEAALVRGTDFIDAGFIFKIDPFEDGVVHPLLVKATALMAVHALASTLNEKASREIVSEKKNIEGVGGKEVTYEAGTRADPYHLVTLTLAPIAVRKDGRSGTSVRAVR